MITFLFRTTNTSLSLSFTFSFPSFVHKLMKSTTKKLNYQVSLLRPRINVARGGSRIEKMDNSSTKNSTLFMRYENYYSNEKLFLFFLKRFSRLGETRNSLLIYALASWTNFHRDKFLKKIKKKIRQFNEKTTRKGRKRKQEGNRREKYFSFIFP